MSRGPMLEPPRETAAEPAVSDVPARREIDHEPVSGTPEPLGSEDPAPLEPPATLPPGGLSLEVIPDERGNELDPGLQPLPDPATVPDRARAGEDARKPPEAAEGSQRRRGLGALFRSRSQEVLRAPARDALDATDDPAGADALRKRLEREIRETAGRRLRSLDVRVIGETVRVRARADRFWNRKGLRRAIEGLPSLAGYDADITVD
jgi:hypothetical protein